MRSWLRSGAVAASAIVACHFAPTQLGDGIDAPTVPDAGPCAGINATCAGPDTLRTCLGSGMVALDTTCDWGCIGPNAHCGKFTPAGGGVVPADLDPDPSLQDIVLVGVIDGNNGSIAGLRGAGLDGQIVNGIGYYIRGNITVFRFKSIRITGGQVALGGDHPIALVATGDIVVDDAIDAQGACSGSASIAGGFRGGAAGAAATGSGGGLGGAGDNFVGGGGGGYGSNGGAGGTGNTNTAAGGVAFGDETIGVLSGGGGGGGGGHGAAPIGGGGGGAIQLAAGGTITITTNGAINAGGCGGTKGANGDSGGGGGAGGTILVEGHDLLVQGKLAVNGGGGGAGGGGTDGSNASVDRGPTTGGPGGNASGGSGAGGASLAGQPGLVGSSRSGGGGGAIGRIRLASRSGSATVDNQQLSPALDDNPTTCTLGSAAVH